MHNPAPVIENDIHKLLFDCDIHTDHLISARRLDLIIINKKKKKKRSFKTVNFAVPADNRIKLKECGKKYKYLNLAWDIEKAVEHVMDDCITWDWYFWPNDWRIIKRPGGLGSWRTGRYYPIDSITENA